MVAEPLAFAWSLPALFTVTILELLLFQVIFCPFLRPVIFSVLLCPLIMVSLEELILGAASVTQTVPGRIADSAGSMASTKTVIRDIRIFFHFFIAIPPSKKYDGSLY